MFAAELRILAAVITATSDKYKITEKELLTLPKAFWSTLNPPNYNTKSFTKVCAFALVAVYDTKLDDSVIT